MQISSFKKVLIILRQSTKHANFLLGVQFPLKRNPQTYILHLQFSYITSIMVWNLFSLKTSVSLYICDGLKKITSYRVPHIDMSSQSTYIYLKNVEHNLYDEEYSTGTWWSEMSLRIF